MGKTNRTAAEELSAAIVDALGSKSGRRSRMGVYEILPGKPRNTAGAERISEGSRARGGND